MSVAWVQNGSGRYEVSSKEHLLQIMNQGSLYTDTGSAPTDYWDSSYIQTQNIDLVNDHASILPIGSSSNDKFTGNYDGSLHKISNWSHTVNSGEKGLFGYAEGGKIQRMRLTGVWNISYTRNTGFLCAFVDSSTSVYDIEGDFAVGTSITDGSVAANTGAGTLIGRAAATSDLYGLTVRGSVDMPDVLAGGFVGGVIGDSLGGTITMVRNLATFPSGINGVYAGGIVGRSVGATISRVLNGMIGDVEGTGLLGGITGGSQGSDTIDRAVNSMTGNISSSGNAFIGGIVGRSLPDNVSHFSGTVLLNYMTGDLTSNTAAYTGGIVGNINRSPSQTTADATIDESISAMNGSASGSVIGTEGFTPSQVVATRVNTFGMSTTQNTYSTSTLPSDALLIDHPVFTDLPYFEMVGTDPDGTVYEWDFIYGNVGGNSSYALYTHVVLHKEDIVYPLLVDFDLPSNNTTVYATFIHYTNDLVQQENLTIISIGVVPPLTVFARPTYITVRIGEVDGASAYRLSYEGPVGGEIIFGSDLALGNHNITNIVPETAYTVRLYADTGSGFSFVESFTATTPPDVAANYDVGAFQEDGVFRLTSLPATTISSLSALMNELFTTGDVVDAVKTNPGLKTTFINLGDTQSIKEINGVLLPFQETSGAGQGVSVILSDDATNVTVSYDDTANSITVGTVEYFVGDSFILDGRKITVVDV